MLAKMKQHIEFIKGINALSGFFMWFIQMLCSIKMNSLPNILIGLLIFSGQSLFGQMGRAALTYQYVYELDNTYFPHDYFVASDMAELLDTAVSILGDEQTLKITNTFNDGFTGHEVKFLLSSDLGIIEAEYQEWTDMIDGSELDYTEEKVVLSMSENPFKSELITAHYTLQIREDYFAGKQLRKKGAKDTTAYRIFNGKFKLYSEKEKEKGRDWIIDKNEIMMGVKDSSGVYLMPGDFAEFKFGTDALKALLKEFEIDRTESTEQLKSFVTLEIFIDENGHVDKESMAIWEPMRSLEILKRLKMNKALMTEWYPATYKGRPVKSELNLPLKFK
ncbi:MAG: hypothetical protein ACJAXX_000573 [Roseivirga sp.]|jgi:hypothetical protein